MLTLSPSAVEAVRRITDDDRLPDTVGLRIFTGTSPDGTPGMQLALAEQPADSDAVVEQEDAHVFVDAHLTADLDDKVLDADIAGNEVRFTLHEAPAT